MNLKALSIILVFLCFGCQAEQPHKISEIVKTDGGFQLLYKGKPYFIKGAVSSHKFELIKKYGGNSVRTGNLTHEKLSMLKNEGLTVLYSLSVKAERDGFDYDDEQMVKQQFERVIAEVNEMKNEPAILFWQLGNELDFVDPETPPNWKVYDAINDMAKEIHKIDPDRAVLTVLGTGKKWKLEEFIKRCPDMDLVGINAYADIGEIPEWFAKYNFNKPFIVTEWGPTGHWQVPQTSHGITVEENSTEKANSYKKHYEEVILGTAGQCLGSYVFLWRQHQEQTHTWYGMFDKQWRETPAVDVMRYEWTSTWPENRAPEITFFKIEGKDALDDIIFSDEKTHIAEIAATDPDGDEMVYDWEILPENSEFGYGGHGEKKPEPVDVIQSGKNQERIEFSTPQKAGSYRLFVYIYDEGGNHFSYANIPFYVEK